MTNRIARRGQFAVRLSTILAVLPIAGAAQAATAGWRATGPFGGDAGIVRTVPKVRDLVLAGSRNGLLFVSLTGGAYWNNIAFPPQFAGVLHALEIDPRTDGTWYAGMESTNAWSSGIFRTADSGRTWTLLPGTKGLAVWSIALWPRNPDVIAAGTASGVYLSRDAGATWKHISPADDPELRPVVSLAFHPANSNTIYAGTTHLPWRTSDGGATWKSIHTGMMDDSDVFSIQVDRLKPERVFASACSGVYGSSDGAERWSKLETPKGAFRTYFVAIDPKHEETVFAGTSEGLLKSADSGRAWRKVSPEAVRSISFDAWVPGRIFFASSSGGLMISTDGGDTLRSANFGFTNRNFTTLTGAGNVLYSSSVYESTSGGVYRTDNLGLRWVHAGDPPADQLLHMVAAPDNPKDLFAAGYRSGLLESIDGGKSWTARKAPAEGALTSALLPFRRGGLLVATDRGLFRLAAGAPGKVVTAQGMPGAASWNQVSALAIQTLQEAGRNIIAALAPNAALVSEDLGETWRPCGASGPDGRSSTFYGVTFDSGDSSVALAATPAGLVRSTDGCRSWSPVRRGLEEATAAPVLFHPTRPGEAYVSQGGRILRSTDGGQSWSLFDDGARGNSGPSSLFVLPSVPDRLFALFPRRGVFSTSIGAEVAPQRLPAGRPGNTIAKNDSDARGESHFK
jgi:photosystem II stability/assembly factor-like uncharacterized protein